MSTAPVMARVKEPIPPVIEGECFILDEYGSFIEQKTHIHQSYTATRYWSRVLKCTVVAYCMKPDITGQIYGWKPFLWYKDGISITPDKHNPHKKYNSSVDLIPEERNKP